MRRIAFLALLLMSLALPAAAQATTRPATISWTCTGCTGVVSFGIYQCVSTTACVPSTTGTPLATVTTGTSYSTTETVGTVVGITIVATYPPCTATSSLTVPCGGGGASTAITQPIPPQGQGATTVIINIP
jgi:hypothetical protein